MRLVIVKNSVSPPITSHRQSICRSRTYATIFCSISAAPPPVGVELMLTLRRPCRAVLSRLAALSTRSSRLSPMVSASRVMLRPGTATSLSQASPTANVLRAQGRRPTSGLCQGAFPQLSTYHADERRLGQWEDHAAPGVEERPFPGHECLAEVPREDEVVVRPRCPGSLFGHDRYLGHHGPQAPLVAVAVRRKPKMTMVQPEVLENRITLRRRAVDMENLAVRQLLEDEAADSLPYVSYAVREPPVCVGVGQPLNALGPGQPVDPVIGSGRPPPCIGMSAMLHVDAETAPVDIVQLDIPNLKPVRPH